MSRVSAALLLALSATTLFAQSSDPRLTVADVERVSGLKGIQLVSAGSVTGAGAGLNFASADKHMVLMVNFGPAALYRRAKEQKTIGGLPMPSFAKAAAAISNRIKGLRGRPRGGGGGAGPRPPATGTCPFAKKK
jgi:hypothetical protein